MSRSSGQHGFVLVFALVASTMLISFLFAGMLLLQTSARNSENLFRSYDQALDVARAGVADAHSWFRRQASQPVTSFSPRRDLNAFPVVNETDDPTIGLVREYEIGNGYWGRYEVRFFSDTNGNGRADFGEGAVDVTVQRALLGAGTVWQIDSQGFVYKLVDSSMAWNEGPNLRVARAVVASEIQRITLVVPGAGALCCERGAEVFVGNRGRVDGTDGAGILFPGGSGVPEIVGDVLGNPDYGSLPEYDASLLGVFGLGAEELRASADLRLTGSMDLPSPIPDYSLVFIEGDHTVSPSQPLRGTGVLVVDGDLTISSSTNSYFVGLIYVTGRYVQHAPSIVRGAVVCSAAEISGVGDLAELSYDGSILGELRLRMGRYRMTRAMQRLDVRPAGGIQP